MARSPINPSELSKAATGTGALENNASNRITGPGYLVGYRVSGTTAGTFVLRADDGSGAKLVDGIIGVETGQPTVWMPQEVWQPYADGMHVTITGTITLTAIYRPAGLQ